MACVVKKNQYNNQIVQKRNNYLVLPTRKMCVFNLIKSEVNVKYTFI